MPSWSSAFPERFTRHAPASNILYHSHNGIKQNGLFVCSWINLLFQLITEGHELVDFGNNAVLFCERREWMNTFHSIIGTKSWHFNTIHQTVYIS